MLVDVALPCARCMTVPPAEAKFCTGCGAPIAELREAAASAPVAPAANAAAASGAPAATKDAAPAGARVCRGCGVVQAAERDTCEVCKAAHAEGSVVVPRDDTAYWVAVRCRFQCRSCGHISPLDHLDMDGSVTCLRCGIDQHFDVSSWKDGLDHAMRVGLLAGESGKYARVGKSASTVEHVQSGMRIEGGMVTMLSLRVSAGPGHPLCQRCRVPLVVDVADNVATSRCPTCGTGMRCKLPEQARRMCKPVRAVLAEELATDRPDAKVDSNGKAAGAVAITCPHCSAPLRVTGSASIVTCEYCKTSSRIPRRTLFQLGHDHPVPQVWWLQFSTAEARRRVSPSRPKQLKPPPPVEREPDRPPAPPPPKRHPAAGIALALAVFALVGFVGFREHVARWRDATQAQSAPTGSTATTPAEPANAGTSGGAATATATAKRPPAMPYVPIDCTCGTMRLAVHTTKSADRTTVRLQAGRKGGESFELGELETSKRALGIGLACPGDRLVIAAGTEVWGFSLSAGSLAWRAELPAPYRYSPKEPEQGVSIQCRRMPIVGRSVNVPTAPKSFTRVNVETGAVARGR